MSLVQLREHLTDLVRGSIHDGDLVLEYDHFTTVEVDHNGHPNRPWQVWIRSYDRAHAMSSEDAAGTADTLNVAEDLARAAWARCRCSVTEPLHCDYPLDCPDTDHIHDINECCECGGDHCCGSTRCALNGG